MNNGMSLSGYVWYIVMVLILMYAIKSCGAADADDRAIGTDAKPQLRAAWPWEGEP
jgi:hypothetical protein